jgi:peptidoglycan hydrolase-like protein with peptidoglycan-binding domain
LITCYDSAYNDQFPADPQAVAGYVDGGIGDQPNAAYLVTAFPAAYHLSIALDPSHDADCLDIENGAATPESAAAWYQRQKARGVPRPCLYADASAMEADVVPVILAAGIPRESVRLWSAHYTGSAHVCGPASCGATSVSMDGTQWTDSAMGRVLDQSLLLDDFFGPPAPVPPQPLTYLEFDMSKLPVLQQGDADQPGQFWHVRRMQCLVALTGRLNGITEARINDDGVFGPATGAAVAAVQSHAGITADQVCGPATWSVLLTGSPGNS